MKLVWARYDKTQPPKYYLLLVLGEEGDCTLALYSDNIPQDEANRIREIKEELDKMDMTSLHNWFSTNTPLAYKEAYRKFKTKDLCILNEYGLKPLNSINPSQPPTSSTNP